MRVLITGMSGTGKSASIGELARRGFRAVDLDTSEWSHWIDATEDDYLTPRHGKDWVWQDDRVRGLLSTDQSEILFVSGCAENMHRVFDLIDTIILLSAPLLTIMQRLRARLGEGYGQIEDDRRKVAELIELIEPLLRQIAHFEIDTRQPLIQTVDQILGIVV